MNSCIFVNLKIHLGAWKLTLITKSWTIVPTVLFDQYVTEEKEYEDENPKSNRNNYYKRPIMSISGTYGIFRYCTLHNTWGKDDGISVKFNNQTEISNNS